MNNRSSLLSNPLVLGIGAFVIGLLIGWLFLSAVALSPFVRITNVDPVDLKQEYKQQWIVDVADAYAVTHDLDTARNHLRWFTTDELEESLSFAFLERNTKGDAPGAARITAFADAMNLNLASGTPPQPGATPTPGGTRGTDNLGTLLLLLAGIILLVAAGLFLYMRIRGRQAAPKPAAVPAEPASQTPAPSAGVSEQASVPPPVAPPPTRPGATPIAKSLGTFAATYKFGEDNYDTSFTLETTRGEFLGETGMGSSETIGEGKPDKVTAFDIWLFDKTDVRTVTQILMSDAAFNDQTTRQRLATKGELVLAEKGKTVRLETATLIVDCEIVDLVYASTPGLPPNSHFQKLIVEMVPSQK